MRKYATRFIKEVVLYDKIAILIACIFSAILAIADVSTKYLPKFFVDCLLEENFKSSLIFIFIALLTHVQSLFYKCIDTSLNF